MLMKLWECVKMLCKLVYSFYPEREVLILRVGIYPSRLLFLSFSLTGGMASEGLYISYTVRCLAPLRAWLSCSAPGSRNTATPLCDVASVASRQCLVPGVLNKCLCWPMNEEMMGCCSSLTVSSVIALPCSPPQPEAGSAGFSDFVEWRVNEWVSGRTGILFQIAGLQALWGQWSCIWCLSEYIAESSVCLLSSNWQ